MASDAPHSPGPLVLRIKLRYPDVETFVEKFSVNVGRSGLFLTTRGLQPIATELRFELRLADDQVVLAGVGRVAAVYEPDDERPEAPYGMAIEFMRVTREGRDLVMRMLEHRRSHGLGEPALPVPELHLDEVAAMEAEARRSSGAIRLPQRPATLEAERPRMPRTRAVELVAQLAAQPMEEAEREVARSEAVALDALLARTATQERPGGAGEAVDLARALERARAIAGAASASGEDDRFSAELAELSRPIAVEPLARVPQPLEMAEGTLRGVSARMRQPLAEVPPAGEGSPRGSRGRATGAPAPAGSAAAAAPREDAPPRAAEPAPRAEALAAARPAQPPRERFSAFTKRVDDPLAEHTPPPGFAPQATPSYQTTPRPGAPSTLAAAAQMRAEADAIAEAARTSPERAAPPESALPDDADTTQPDPEPRRKRVGRPERLTRPPGVFARRAAEATSPPPLDAVVVDLPLPAEPVAPAPPRPAKLAAPDAELAAPDAEPAAPDAEPAGRAMSDATFARVLAELEESDADPPAQRVPLSSGAAAASAAPYDPLDQLALDDLDDAEPAGSPDGRRAGQPWYAAVDETAPVEQIDLDARLDSGIHSLEDSGFEILAEAELANHDSLEGTASSAPRYQAPYEEPPSRSYVSAAPSAETYDGPAREPITARSALAAAVSRPTWTRSKALDQAEPAQPVNELAPPTIPGRVATRDIDLESALDALDIEADAPVVPLQPRQPEPRGAADDDDFPIELEFDDP